MRRQFQGQGASRGSALGRAWVRLPDVLEVGEQHIAADQVDAELERLHQAVGRVRAEMQALRERLQDALAPELGQFLDLHALLLEDPELLQGLDEAIRGQQLSADYALHLQRERITAGFRAMDDVYFRSRVEDVDQVIGRIHASLHARHDGRAGMAGEVLVAETVPPAELAQLQQQGVVAVVTTGGSPLSHSAILARSLHLPMVVGVPGLLQRLSDGEVLTVDGTSGEVVAAPGPADLRRHRERRRAVARELRALRRLRREPTRTLDGVEIGLYANAESPGDVARAHALGAAGIGLYRTEFLFLQRTVVPGEDEQFHAYRDVLLAMDGRPVTIRLLDLGADKADRTGLALRDEPNPALGLRGIRLAMARPALLETQLRALLRASAYGRLRILVPMVAGREQVRHVRTVIDRLSVELRTAGHGVAEGIQVGAMIEVPAAALALSTLIGDVDFLSIGTNDLVQYLLAADRDNEALGEFYTPLHPAVLRVLRDVIRTGKVHGRPVSVCGELAGDPDLSPLLLALGLEQFSLHPATLLDVRQVLRACDLSRLRARLPALMRAPDRPAIERWITRQQPRIEGA
ncbi:phosphoenolpyruvate--protein phosphotransferase [Lysobacter sp. GX 14042]|uniref:phosphoenolpyruvate--protein phosphotransferase n=1 Tax=Lysobacter sp. GX 14042 TaxID=2907155 RepID=UPI001F3BA377|nr:phosphoenolpyruvate--protein phosphotransferase [Lysobacter sp. GX 14042]MCE7031867.1 phosphoenolpyruvate--protein phosphotransferase [Lysobacter sp. GX 14042]